MTRLFDRPIDTVRGLVRFLAMAELDFWYKAAWDKQTRDMDRRAIQKRDMDRGAIGVSSIFDAAFLYLPFFCYGIAVFATSQYSPHAESEVELRAKMV